MQHVTKAEFPKVQRGEPGRENREKFWADREYQAAFEYSEWLDGQGVVLANDNRTHEDLVKEWQASRG